MLIFVGVLALLVFILFRTQIGVLFQGFYHLFVADVAKTPEGAKAIYMEKIQDAQDRYARSAKAVETIAGKLGSREDDLGKTEKQLADVQKAAEQFAAKQMWDQVALYDQQNQALETKKEMLAEQVRELKTMLADAQKVHNLNEQLLTKLKSDMQLVITKIETNNMTAQMYKELDTLRKETNLDKLMGHVEDAVVETRERAVGAKAVHQNKLDTKIADANDQARRMSTDSLEAKLRAKYAQQPNTTPKA